MNYDYHIYCPSYGRAKTAASHKFFDLNRFTYIVHEEEEEEYREIGVDLLVIPRGRTGSAARARNYAIDNVEHDYIVLCDDDIKALRWRHIDKSIPMSPEWLDHHINTSYQLIEDLGVNMWGVNCTDDPMAYRISKPFSFNRVCLAPFQGFKRTELRWDEVLYLKDDYDWFLQHMNRDGRVVRSNFIHHLCDHQKLDGGCQRYRTSWKEEEQGKLFMKKWGSKIVKPNWKSKDSINFRICL